ncbi:hypothetical protein EI94DRAFT_1849394 [Lactarius quietus]|nr:hypothetical protein EI94DRAFT_1849394 [Lactarius quietus]
MVVKCPDGLFRCVIFGLGPYIADYPEQVWLAGLCQIGVQNSGTGHRRTHQKTDLLIKGFDAVALWDSFGIYKDIVPFTHGFPHADIHELLLPDLLHQVIKGVFKDHLLHGISAVPPFPGLRQFPDGRDFTQWTGNDLRALMKVYLGAIAGYLPSVMFHDLRDIFITTGVRTSISLPRQHALVHYYLSIQLFGSPNGLLFLHHQSKHIQAVKEPWHRSSCYYAIFQMLRVLLRLQKILALRHLFASHGMMKGTMALYMAGTTVEVTQEDATPLASENAADEEEAPVEGVSDKETLSIVTLLVTTESGYPQNVLDLVEFIQQPDLILTLQRFIYLIDHPGSAIPSSKSSDLPQFQGRIHVHHSALATFFLPSDLCGMGGMRQERIRSMPSWFGLHPRCDTIFVVLDDSLPGMEGMVVT